MNIKILFPIDQAKVDSPELALDVMSKGLNELIDNGALRGPLDDILVDYEFQKNTGYAIAILKDGSIIDGAKLNQKGVGIGVYEYVTYATESSQLLQILDKTFSMASIEDRMRIQKRDPKVRLRYIVLDYKRYWKSKEQSIKKNPELAKNLKRMFLSDVNMMMTEVLPYIEEGKQLTQLIGTNQVDATLSKIARELSLIYRRTLKAIKTQGQIPKAMWSKLTPKYAEFMNALIVKVFPGIDQILSKPEESITKTYSYLTDGRIDLFK